MNEKTNVAIRTLSLDEISLLTPCLEGLAGYHNGVAEVFPGIYPVMPIETHLMHMRDHIQNDTATFVGLFAGSGTLGGFGMASYEGKYGEIDYLYVSEGLRGHGHGGRLFERLLAVLREKGVRFIDVAVVKGNPARRFYEKRGFVVRSETLSRRLNAE